MCEPKPPSPQMSHCAQTTAVVWQPPGTCIHTLKQCDCCPNHTMWLPSTTANRALNRHLTVMCQDCTHTSGVSHTWQVLDLDHGCRGLHHQQTIVAAVRLTATKQQQQLDSGNGAHQYNVVQPIAIQEVQIQHCLTTYTHKRHGHTLSAPSKRGKPHQPPALIAALLLLPLLLPLLPLPL